MTTNIVNGQPVATKPYSQERMASMARANRIEQVQFAARRKGERLSVADAAAIVDAELERIETAVVENSSEAANDATTAQPLPATRDELLALVSDGKVFAAEFIKRDGSTRTMQCRLGVAKHLAGGIKAFDDAAKGILTVFDMKAAGYRSIRIDALQALTIKGQRYAH